MAWSEEAREAAAAAHAKSGAAHQTGVHSAVPAWASSTVWQPPKIPATPEEKDRIIQDYMFGSTRDRYK